MKTNTASERINKVKKMVTILAFSLIAVGTLFNYSYAGNARHLAFKNKPKSSLEHQILRYIHQNKTPVTCPQKGTVMISFSVNENNELSDVVSYSQIPSLDQYLVSCLKNKPIDLEKSLTNINKKQYVKIRFNIDG